MKNIVKNCFLRINKDTECACKLLYLQWRLFNLTREDINARRYYRELGRIRKNSRMYGNLQQRKNILRKLRHLLYLRKFQYI